MGKHVDRYVELVTITLPINEARLLVPALMDRLTMISADHAEGRTTEIEKAERWTAVNRVLGKVREAIR